MDMPDFPPFVILDPAVGTSLHDALSALAYPMDDYAGISVAWPITAADVERMHEWMHRNGMTPNA